MRQLSISETPDLYPDLAIGEKVRIIGKHPWAGSDAEFISRDNTRIGPALKMRVVSGDAMDGHEFYVSSPGLIARINLAPVGSSRGRKRKA